MYEQQEKPMTSIVVLCLIIGFGIGWFSIDGNSQTHCTPNIPANGVKAVPIEPINTIKVQ